MRALRDVIRRALMSIFSIPESPERSHEQHRAIRDAIAAGDAERARARCATTSSGSSPTSGTRSRRRRRVDGGGADG